MVVITLPTSTTNMTGLPIILRGLSLSTAPMAAPRTIAGSQMDLRFFNVLDMNSSECLSCVHHQVLENGTEAKRGEECQRSEDQDHADQQHAEQWRGDRKRAHRRRYIL